MGSGDEGMVDATLRDARQAAVGGLATEGVGMPGGRLEQLREGGHDIGGVTVVRAGRLPIGHVQNVSCGLRPSRALQLGIEGRGS